MKRARPYQPPNVNVVPWAGTCHGSTALCELYEQFEFASFQVVISRQSDCAKLKCTKVTIQDGTFVLEKFDIRGEQYFIDIVNIGPGVNIDMACIDCPSSGVSKCTTLSCGGPRI
ncbi:hypothetical protein Plhal703r1_c39g0136821 [Plasmopara halstedii]